MTRKDYEELAAALRTVNVQLRKQALNSPVTNDYFDGGVDGALLATSAIAVALADDNPRFDRARFMAAANPARLTR